MQPPFEKQKTSARRNVEDVDSGASGSMMTSPAEINFGGSSPSPSEANNRASSSSIAPTVNCYDVFLSFRGQDTRNGFTSHLYKGLLNAGIHAFRDDDELPEGKSIGPELMAAITNSKILIPILSGTYGTSRWCLNELVQMMEGKNKNGQIVLPIFYKVKPADVRHQKGSFGDAFHDWEGRLKERNSSDLMHLENWKKALAEVSNLKGYEAIGEEAKLVELIVRKVSSELKKKFELVISENLVGIDNHVEKVMEFVNKKSHDTLFVGIYGMGGIGKTTLAKAIYNKLLNHYERHSFIADVRESSARNGVHDLQKQLIHDILQEKIEVCNKDEGIKLISSRFKDKKVLVLLDDADNVAQLNCLAGKHEWFSSGSIIIITTRVQIILEKVRVDYLYDHKELDIDQSLTLFNKHAFRENSHPEKFKDLTNKVVKIIGGLPLSLEVLGSLLCGRERAFWKDTIKKLEKAPHKEVQDRLRISYEALEDAQKQIFLDIACFFIGTDKRIASYMWDACNLFPEEGIEILRLMSLIKIEGNHGLRMHDQLRDLGREIVREENRQKPSYRSRLWQFEEVQEVLNGNKESDKVEAICLSRGSDEGDIYTEKQFKNLTSLRFLDLNWTRLRGDFEDSMKGLKWLRWPHCPKNFEVKNFHVKELVVLEMSHSDMKGKWNGWSSFVMATNLKFLDLSSCYDLENTDFLSDFKNLEVLILNNCQRLQRIDSSIVDMKALRRLELHSCQNLVRLPEEIGKLNALEQLLLSYTPTLSALPDSIESLENLEILDISHSGIEKLPNRIGRLRKLRKLLAFGCRELGGGMPESMCNLSFQPRLDFYHRFKLQSLPDLPSSLIYLAVTSQSGKLPSLSHLTHLKELNVMDCRFLQCIQALPLASPESLNTSLKLETLKVDCCSTLKKLDVSQFMNLRTLSARGCPTLFEVRGLDKLIYLESLTVESCGFKRLDLPKSKCLKTLAVYNCNDLVKIRDLDRLEFLESLIIRGCTSIDMLLLPKSMSMKELDASFCLNLAKIQDMDRLMFLETLRIQDMAIERLDLPKSGRLKGLDIGYCKNLVEIQGLDRLESLQSLNISRCISIERLDLPKSSSLKRYYMLDCKKFAEIQGLDRLEFLEVLRIEKCTSIERLDLPKFGRLKGLDIGDCENLVEIQGLDRLESLQSLNISRCNSIERLDLPKCGRMKELDVGDCENLVEIKGLDRLESLQNLNISRCNSIERLDLPKSERLKALDVGDCENLVKIQGLDRLESLQSLNISGCISIERLDLPKPKSLKTLYAGFCKKFAEIQGLDILEFLEKLNIKCYTSIERPDLPISWRLKELDEDCENLVEIQDLDRLKFLEKLRIIGCKSLKISCIYEEKQFGMTESESNYSYDSDE